MRTPEKNNMFDRDTLSVEELNDIYLNIVPLLLPLNKSCKLAAYNFILGLSVATQMED